MPDSPWRDLQHAVVALLDESAAAHEAEGRVDLAHRHRLAADGLRSAALGG